MADGQPTLALPRTLRHGLRAYGVDLAAVGRRLGIEASGPMAPAQLDALLDAALGEVSDPCAGLDFGGEIRPELFGVGGFAALSAGTFDEALRRLARYKVIATTDRLELTPTRGGTRVVITVGRGSPRVTRLRADGELAFLIRFASVALGRRVRPITAAITGQPACGVARYEAVLGVPVRVGARHDELVFATADLACSLITHDPELGETFVTTAERRMRASAGDIVARVRAAIPPLLRGGSPTLTAIASTLATSERSLQRSLAEHGTSFTELVDGVRRELSHDLLADPELTRDEVAYLLGFARTSSLHRAVARWRSSPDA